MKKLKKFAKKKGWTLDADAASRFKKIKGVAKPQGNILFYKGLKRLKPKELEKTLSELLENSKIAEDTSKSTGSKKEYVTSCVKPLRLHVINDPLTVYMVESETEVKD